MKAVKWRLKCRSMLKNTRTMFHATVILFLIAVAPIIVAHYGYHQVGISGCKIDPFEPKPGVHCDNVQDEPRIQYLLDFGVFSLITVPLAGTPAVCLLALTVYTGIRDMKRRS